jgi:hypothetical protein
MGASAYLSILNGMVNVLDFLGSHIGTGITAESNEPTKSE